MTYQRFEDLPVWQEAARLYEQTDEFLENPPSPLRGSFRDQLERAVLSISNNIAEGFERGTTNELLAFLYISRGSAGEVRSMLALLSRRPWANEAKNKIVCLMALAESCSRQLRAWADNLQNSPIEGQRKLTNRTRQEFDQKKRAENMQRQMLKNLNPNHPLRIQAEERGFI